MRPQRPTVRWTHCRWTPFPACRWCRSNYTWWNFLPVFLFEQFGRFANAYFLLVAVLQTIPSISITNGLPTNLLPLSIVLSFDGVVTAREDYKRHQDDNRANNTDGRWRPGTRAQHAR